MTRQFWRNRKTATTRAIASSSVITSSLSDSSTKSLMLNVTSHSSPSGKLCCHGLLDALGDLQRWHGQLVDGHGRRRLLVERGRRGVVLGPELRTPDVLDPHHGPVVVGPDDDLAELLRGLQLTECGQLVLDGRRAGDRRLADAHRDVLVLVADGGGHLVDGDARAASLSGSTQTRIRPFLNSKMVMEPTPSTRVSGSIRLICA